ncbi:MAG: DUF2207 domain-containing protein [Actinobacteria bacterium]|nr:DUF2207 domain-containing protein [Actinomycetota bacterium]
MFTLKRILCSIAALAIIGGTTALFMFAIHADPTATGSGGGEEKYMFLEQVDTRLRVDSKGELTVSEKLSYDLGSKAWHGLYQDVILNHGEQVKDVRVWRVTGGFADPMAPGSGIELGVGGAYGSYGYGVVKAPSRRLRIVWNVNDTGHREFIVRYRLHGAVENYRDASSLLWDVWGTGWETGVGLLNVGIAFPGAIDLVHPRTDGLQTRTTEPSIDGRRGSFTVRSVPKEQPVQVQVAAKPLSGMPKENSDVLPSIAKESARIDAVNADRAKRSDELRERPFIWFLLWSLAGALAGLAIVYLANLVMGRDRTRPIPAGGSYQYPPEKIPAPVIAKALGGAETENLVSATLLSLLQRDIFRVMPSTTKKEDIGIMNNVGETSYNATTVAPWERPVADLLQSTIDDHPEHAPDFTKLKKHLKPSEAESKIEAFDSALDAEMPKFNLERTYRGHLRRTLICVFAGLLFLLALIAMLGSGGTDAAARWDASWWALPLVGFSNVLFWSALEGNAFYRLKPEQEERVRKWETYQDFFRNMDLSNQYPLTVEIWDEALVYAAAFGFAEKVITNMPRTNADGSPAAGDTAGLGSIANNAFAVSALSSMTSGIGSVTGMASDSSSGGGFSGGASGGGGGGGW